MFEEKTAKGSAVPSVLVTATGDYAGLVQLRSELGHANAAVRCSVFSHGDDVETWTVSAYVQGRCPL